VIRWTVAGLAVAAILTAWALGEDEDVGTTRFVSDGTVADWSYKGAKGPQNWGELSPEWAACSDGGEQSPIDLAGAEDGRVPPVAFRYRRSRAAIENYGNVIHVSFRDAGKLTARGGAYGLGEISFHTPGEHRIAGRRFPAELRLIHSRPELPPIVIAVLIKEGEENPALREALARVPAEFEEHPLRSEIDPIDLLPGGGAGEVYSYLGSATTPPCTEGIQWIVYERPLELSEDQIDALAKAYPDNARPIQPLGEREIVRGRLG
jgi:carbonic anhydrase